GLCPCGYASCTRVYGVGSPPPALTGERPNTSTAPKAPSASLLHISIARHFHTTAGMGHRTRAGRPNLVGVFPQIPTLERMRPGLPRLRPPLHLGVVQLDF